MRKLRTTLAVAMATTASMLSYGAAADTTPVDIIISHATVAVTMDADRRVLTGASFAIQDGNIVAVGPSADIAAQYQAPKHLDARGKLVMPGLVNTHTHAAMTIFRGLADDLSLDTWLNEHIWPAEAKYINEESVRIAGNLAFAEMIRSGTTTFNDMYFFSETLALAAKKAGMRGIIGEGILSFKTPSAADAAQALATTERLAEKWAGDRLITISAAPHSIYATSPDALKASKAMAERYKLPLHIHVSETKKEVADAQKNFGLTPFEHLDQLGFFAGDSTVVAAHAVHPSDSDIALMRDRGVGVAHNPSSNMKLSSGIAPVPAMLAAGVAVGLGTDGAASNNGLNLFNDMRAAALLHKVATGDPTIMSARQTVESATIGGAQVLGMQDTIGSLEVGKRADLLLVDLNQPHLIPMYDPYSHIVYAMQASDVDTVMIEGRIVMENRKLLTLDETKVLAEASALGASIAEK